MLKNHWSKVFEGPRHRVRFRTIGPTGTEPRIFAVESLLKEYHVSTSFSTGDLHYFDIDLDSAWDQVTRLVPGVRFPVAWARLMGQHPAERRFHLAGTANYEFPIPHLGVFTPVDRDKKVAYDAKPAGWLATLTGCKITVSGESGVNALEALAARVELLYKQYEDAGWPEPLTGFGGGYGKSEVRVLKQLRKKG